VKHLLDTHVLVWWLAGDRKLRREHTRVLERSERTRTPVGISAITLWEIAKLVEHGRIALHRAVDEALSEIEASPVISIVPIDARIAVEVGASARGSPPIQSISSSLRPPAVSV
jgi:PIN domain nuclease of toxin-antitoxin system